MMASSRYSLPRPRAWRYALAAPLCLLALALSLLGCTPTELQLQAAAADAIARGVSAAQPGIVRIYETDCAAAVEVSPPGEGKAALAACRRRWDPAWRALAALTAAQDAWATAIAAGQSSSWLLLVDVACDLVTVLRSVAPSLSVPVLSQVCPAPAVTP